MASDKPTSEGKWLISLMSGIIFMLIASPMVFQLTQKVLGKPLGLSFLDKSGVPTMTGLLVHGIVYTLIVRLMMVN